MLCWVYVVDGVRAGPAWVPSSEESLKWRARCDGLPILEISLESVESHAEPHSILPNHTEGHRLNGRDVLSRKAGLRLGKDSTGVEASPNQDKLRRMNKYCRLQGLNRCPLASELGMLPLDHLGFDLQQNYQNYVQQVKCKARLALIISHLNFRALLPVNKSKTTHFWKLWSLRLDLTLL